MTAVLYIIARNDLASLNPGKLAAQCSHASNAFAHHFHAYMQEVNAKPVSRVSLSDVEATSKAFYEWENTTPQGFGTVLVLEAKMKDIYPVIDLFAKNDHIAGIVHDPTYPIVDGEIVHHIPLDTCAYVFIPNKEESQFASSLLKQFPLYR